MKFLVFYSIVVVLIFSVPTNAHFFPNISSIPRSLIPNHTAWDAFLKYTNCHHGQNVDGLAKIKQYFQRFGYIDSLNKNFTDDFDDDLESALKTYQHNFNLNPTGELDANTLQHIIKPRCGNADIVNGTTTMNSGKTPASSKLHTVAHYSFFPGRPRWPARKTLLTYAFAPENELTGEVKAVFGKAFDRWSGVTPLSFRESTSYSSADIKIEFATGEHGDGEPFDGTMGTLAHAFSPPDGKFHLDADENWVIDGDFWSNPLRVTSAVDLESVAVHEIGHLLGLGHSSVEDAIMYPTLGAGARRVNLDSDDIAGVQELYGSNPNFTVTQTPRQERDTNGASSFGSLWSLGFSLVIVLFLLL